jgi:hypothetical protein
MRSECTLFVTRYTLRATGLYRLGKPYWGFESLSLRHAVSTAERLRYVARAPRNKVIVAIANKPARIAWAVLFSGEVYQHQPVGTA